MITEDTLVWFVVGIFLFALFVRLTVAAMDLREHNGFGLLFNCVLLFARQLRLLTNLAYALGEVAYALGEVAYALGEAISTGATAFRKNRDATLVECFPAEKAFFPEGMTSGPGSQKHLPEKHLPEKAVIEQSTDEEIIPEPAVFASFRKFGETVRTCLVSPLETIEKNTRTKTNSEYEGPSK